MLKNNKLIILELCLSSKKYFNDWQKTSCFAEQAIENDVQGIHVFYHEDIVAAVYGSNLLMRSSDILITKPSKLAFYPVPKLLIKRVGGHEACGAVRAAEVGDGTIECESVDRTLQMLDLILNSHDILTMLCNNIIKANEMGVYSGAYKAVKLAINEKRYS